MKAVGLLFVIVLSGVAGCSTDQSDEIGQLRQENQALKALVGPPPSSLEKLYPPQSDGPILVSSMMAMNIHLASIANAVALNDLDQAKFSFERFHATYSEASRLVPEWAGFFKLDRVEELGHALDSGEQGKIMESIGQVGESCHDCHLVNMAKVQQKYHWGDFSEMTVTDPVTSQDLSFRQFKQFLNGSVAGVVSSIQEGKIDLAMNHYEGLAQRFGALKETCNLCHDSERAYYVDSRVQALLEELGTALRSGSADSGEAGRLVEALGMESCHKCHLVHIPAALSNERWAQQGSESTVQN